MHRKLSSRAGGSALLLVLWSLLLLSMSVFGVVEIVQSSVSHAAHLASASQARALALTGLSIAMHPDMKPGNSLLQQQPAAGEKFEVTLRGEAGRLNLNHVLEKDHRDILIRLFTGWGLKQAQAAAVADCLYDWIAPGDKPSPNGAKEADYRHAGMPNIPTGKPFTSFAEVAEVMGMSAVEKVNPDWQDSFTLLSDGPLDVNEASPELISAVLNLPSSQVEAFVEKRNGKDCLPETQDDAPLADTAALKTAFGLGDKTFAAISDQVTVSDPVRRIESTGTVDGVAVVFTVVMRLQSSPPEYLAWKEL